MTPEQRYSELVRSFSGRPGVTQDGRGFGAAALKVGGRIFAMLSSRGDFVVKLPPGRVDSMVALGVGERFDPGHGRQMKEWLSVGPGSALDWYSLAEEALSFVAPGAR